MRTMLDYADADAIRAMQQLTDYDEISEVLRARDSFVQGAYWASGDLMRGTLSACDGGEHLQRRRLLAQLMSDDAIGRHRAETLQPTIESTLAAVADEGRGHDRVVRADLVVVAQRCLHRLAAAAVGLDGLGTSQAVDRFVGYLQAIAAGIGADWAVGAPEPVVAAANDALEGLRVDFFEPSRARRLALLDAGDDAPNDLITLMYRHRDESWDEHLPLREAAVFMVAATQTTTSSLVLLVLRLEEWFARHPEERSFLWTEPEFLRRATAESLRQTVAAPARIRLAVEDVVLASGRTIRAGERVALLFLPANEDSARFGHASAEFDPHREPTEGTPPWGLAFGGGVHACLGRPMVTGSRRQAVDGTVTALARRLYAAGLALDGEPVRDLDTHYPLFNSVPVRLEAL